MVSYVCDNQMVKQNHGNLANRNEVLIHIQKDVRTYPVIQTVHLYQYLKSCNMKRKEHQVSR